MATKFQFYILICLAVLESSLGTGSISSRSSRVQHTLNTTSIRRRRVCQFTTQELQDTVQATFTSVLSGTVFPRTWEEKFHQLQTLITSQVGELRETITVLEQRIIEQSEEQISSCADTARHHSGRTVTVQSAVSARTGDSRRTYEQGEVSRARETIVHGSRPILPPVAVSPLLLSSTHCSIDAGQIYDQQRYHSSVHQYTDALGTRIEEVTEYNNTIHIENGRRVYTYYWVVSDMTRKMRSWTLRESTKSEMFYVGRAGYHMYMRMTPRYSEDSIYLHIGLTRGDFDDALKWPYNYPMRLFVLGHGTSSHDLQSRIWNPWELCSGSNWKKPSRGDNAECIGLGFPHNVLESPEYLWNDCLTVKLAVYLD